MLQQLKKPEVAQYFCIHCVDKKFKCVFLKFENSGSLSFVKKNITGFIQFYFKLLAFFNALNNSKVYYSGFMLYHDNFIKNSGLLCVTYAELFH